jgi:thiamine biosynthesis lipoprotein
MSNLRFKVVEEAFNKVIYACDIHNSNSELSKLNKRAYKEEVVCSPLLWDIIQEARFAYKFSNGAFDISIKPLMDFWGFYKKNPQNKVDIKELEKAKNLVGLNKVIFNDKNKSIKFTLEGMALDLGGIAKGYAIDLAAKNLSKYNITSGMINLGGNILFLPIMPKGKKEYLVSIKSPDNSNSPSNIILKIKENNAVSTSGNYERFVWQDKKKIGHIMIPSTVKTRKKKFSSVSVIAPKAVTSDWLSTAIFVSGNYDFIKKVKTQLPNTFVTVLE